VISWRIKYPILSSCEKTKPCLSVSVELKPYRGDGQGRKDFKPELVDPIERTGEVIPF
jgi:hypothetical protein